eukprot:TRINITY_DN3409_c0_g1_i1.p1 TRINITY_DN3409_c0_g1~~TRINITY_DN3409_c0_g1_i1.p1  ORF type:complete len:261 (+),score=94.07 TRINITY_DN3409_c0_g1_i1:42-785(+)
MATNMKPAKRQRTEKAFEDCTIAELRGMSERIMKLEKAKARDEEEAAPAVKRAVEAQLKSQMLLQRELSKYEVEKLKTEEGRPIVSVVPNVNMELLKALGLDELDEDGTIKDKLASTFLMHLPVRTQHTPPSEQSLHLVSNLSFKYVKKHGELRVFSAYKFGPKVVQAKAKAKRVDNDEVGEGQEEKHTDDQDDEEDQDVENGNGNNEEAAASDAAAGDAAAGDAAASDAAANGEPAVQQGQAKEVE